MATTVTQTKVATRGEGQKRRFSIAPYLFILPHLIFFALFVGYPFFSGLYTSLFKYDYLRPAATEFVGINNYVNLLTPGNEGFRTFWNSLVNTLEFVVYSVPLLVLIPLGLALLLNTKIKARTLFRAIYFAPWALSGAVVALLWWWIFQSQGGLLNYYLADLGVKVPRWLSTLPWAWVSIVICTVWWTLGFNMIILLAALQDIPEQLYEAAQLDGANSRQQLWNITLPLLKPVLLFIVTISIIASFNLFIQPFIMTEGGPARTEGLTTESVMMRIYREAFVENRQGTAAAMSFIVATMMIAISYTNFKLFRKREE
jgi:multiple sugar transport system permease protein